GVARTDRSRNSGGNRQCGALGPRRAELRDRRAAAGTDLLSTADLLTRHMHRSVLALLLLLWAPGAGAMTIERVTSPGGIEAWLVEDHTLPVVAIRFAFPGGAALDPSGKGGLAAMAAALLDEGAGPYDTAAFKTRLEDLVVDLRFETSRDEIGGGMRSLKSNLGEAVKLLRLALTAPRFEP